MEHEPLMGWSHVLPLGTTSTLVLKAEVKTKRREQRRVNQKFGGCFGDSQLSEGGEIKLLLVIKKWKPPAGNLGWYFSLMFLVEYIEKQQRYNILRYLILK